MDLWQTLEQRTTIRRFADRPVGSAIVRRAVRAALHAPAYNHLWEWAFLRIRDADLRVRLADAFGIHDVSDPATLHARFDPLPEEARRIYLRALPLQRTMLLSASTLLVPVYRAKRREARPTGPADRNAHAAIWMGSPTCSYRLPRTEWADARSFPTARRRERGFSGTRRRVSRPVSGCAEESEAALPLGGACRHRRPFSGFEDATLGDRHAPSDRLPRGRVVRNAHPDNVDSYLQDDGFRGFRRTATIEPMG